MYVHIGFGLASSGPDPDNAPPMTRRLRWTSIGLALVGAALLAIAVQAGRWWSVAGGDVTIGPLSSRTCMGGTCRDVGLGWLAGSGLWLRAGMAITIEPLVTLGDPTLDLLPDGWTLVTRDGAWSAQFEHTVLVTPEGREILTVTEDGRTAAGTLDELQLPA